MKQESDISKEIYNFCIKEKKWTESMAAHYLYGIVAAMELQDENVKRMLSRHLKYMKNNL